MDTVINEALVLLISNYYHLRLCQFSHVQLSVGNVRALKRSVASD